MGKCFNSPILTFLPEDWQHACPFLPKHVQEGWPSLQVIDWDASQPHHHAVPSCRSSLVLPKPGLWEHCKYPIVKLRTSTCNTAMVSQQSLRPHEKQAATQTLVARGGRQGAAGGHDHKLPAPGNPT